jgi:hypothetical protein
LALDDLDTVNSTILLRALGQAQCVQTLYELRRDLDCQTATSVSIGELLSVRMAKKKKWDRFSDLAILSLRPWLSLPSIKRFR